MLKEIYEQPRTLQDCIRGRINVGGNSVVLSGRNRYRDKFLNANRIVIVCLWYFLAAALIGEHLIRRFARIPVEVEYASEFRYRRMLFAPNSLVIIVSQSGETADSLAALRERRPMGLRR